MNRNFLPESSPKERLEVLQNNADLIDEGATYFKDLGEDELVIKREEFVNNSIKISNLEDQLDEQKEKFKGQIKPIAAANRILQQEIKSKQVERKGNLYHMANHDSKMMEIYDAEGNFIYERRLRPDEITKVISFPKAANE